MGSVGARTLQSRRNWAGQASLPVRLPRSAAASPSLWRVPMATRAAADGHHHCAMATRAAAARRSRWLVAAPTSSLCLYRDFCTPTSRLSFLRSVRAPPPPYSVLLRAALRYAATTAAAWGASQCRHWQKPRSCKTEWKRLAAQLRSQLLYPLLAHSTPKSATRREAPATAARTTMAGHL